MPVRDVAASFFSDHGIEPCRLVVAVSGGFDSTALLLVLSELPRFELICGHVNHHLRGDESDGDEQYVRELCDRLKVECIVADGTLDPERVRDVGVEAAAREVRIAKLKEIRDRKDAKYIATAHQKNDQAETVLMRLFTGSGLAGLRGIHAVRDDGIIRPLLGVARPEIEAFLRERGETPCADRMNDDPRFLRVRIRQTLRDYEPWVVDNLASIAEQAQEWWPSVQRAIDEVEDVEMTEDATRFHSLPADPWLRRALLHRHILRLDPEARDVSRSDLRRVTVTKNLELLLRRIPRPAPSFEYELAAGETITLAEIGATMSVSKEGQQPFMLPKGAAPHFLVRNRREGDRFHPLGAPGSKKLKDFLIDRKVPAEQRDRLPLLLWNGEIIWIAGVEVSERFKVRDDGGDLYVATINYGAK